MKFGKANALNCSRCYHLGKRTTGRLTDKALQYLAFIYSFQHSKCLTYILTVSSSTIALQDRQVLLSPYYRFGGVGRSGWERVAWWRPYREFKPPARFRLGTSWLAIRPLGHYTPSSSIKMQQDIIRNKQAVSFLSGETAPLPTRAIFIVHFWQTKRY